MSTSRTVLSDISSNSNLKRSHSDSIVEIAKSKRQKTEEEEEEDKENDSPSPNESFEEEEEEEEPSVVAFLSSPGEIHPRSKQYFVYPRGKPSVISKTARCWCLKYLKVLNHIDPDAYDMYIHNDFMCYGELEVIENVLLDLSKDYFPSARSELNFPRAIYAFRRWEALILLLQSSFAWTGIDHGQRMLDMVRLLGACSVTILRQLFPPAFFEPLHEQFDDQRVKKISDRLVNFKEILEQSISLGYQLSRIAGYSSAFTRLLQIVYCNWLFLTEHRRFDFSTIDPSKTNDQSLWQGLIEASQMKIKRFNESFRFFQVLQHYRKFYPEMGGDQHDLRKWPKARRDQFSYARLEQEDNDDQLTNFWLRM